MLSIAIQSKLTTYVTLVTYPTYDTLLNPCEYLQENLEELIVKGIGLGVGNVTECGLISVANLNGQNVYNFTVTVTTTL